MESIYAMLAKIHSLEEDMVDERKVAVKKMQAGLCMFVERYGYLCTDECPCTGNTYVLQREGLILRKGKKDYVGKIIRVQDLTLKEMEFIKKFMVDTLNNDTQHLNDVIGRYIGLYP